METIMSRRSVLAAAALAVASLPAWRGVLATAGAEEPAGETYVALGDSISTGYGLDVEADEPSFATLLAEEYEYELEVLAQDGLTAVALAKQLEDPAVLESIAGASLITLTIGGNDFMQTLYAYLANAYNEAGAVVALTAEDVAEALQAGDTTTLSFALEAIAGFATSSEALATITQFNTCFPQVLGAIKTANPDAKVIVATQYNPYAHLGSGAAALGLDGLSTAFEDCLSVLNQAIVAGCKKFDCAVADVYAKFQKADKNPCNAAFSFTSVNLDFHPNAYGHDLIAQTFSAVISGVDPDESQAAADSDAEKVDAEKGGSEKAASQKAGSGASATGMTSISTKAGAAAKESASA